MNKFFIATAMIALAQLGACTTMTATQRVAMQQRVDNMGQAYPVFKCNGSRLIKRCIKVD